LLSRNENGVKTSTQAAPTADRKTVLTALVTKSVRKTRQLSWTAVSPVQCTTSL